MNKKHIYIASITIAGVLALGSLSNAYALFTMPAQNAAFSISQAKTYYLKGSFNSWAASQEYALTDVTATMRVEEHKTSEFTITKALSKDDELKIWDSFNYWYEQGVDQCSYVDKWSRTTNNGDNYVVPMTATYNIYLKFYDTGDKQVYLTAPDVTSLYLKPNSHWLEANARFAAYFFNDSTSTNEWHDLVQDGDYYGIAIPEGYNNVIFCRMDPATTANNWDNVWTQTSDLTFSASSYLNVLEIQGENWNASDADWRAR